MTTKNPLSETGISRRDITVAQASGLALVVSIAMSDSPCA